MLSGVYLGIDFGERRIGVAVGDSTSQTARPLTVISRAAEPDWPALEKLFKEWQPAALVVGLPPGPDEPQAHSKNIPKKIRKFVAQLEQRFDYPCFLHDEHLSSYEAKYQLKSARQSGRRSKIRAGEKDSMAAAIILNSWFLEQN